MLVYVSVKVCVCLTWSCGLHHQGATYQYYVRLHESPVKWFSLLSYFSPSYCHDSVKKALGLNTVYSEEVIKANCSLVKFVLAG